MSTSSNLTSSLSPPSSSLLISFSGLLLFISSSLWAVWWPEPCSSDCLCSSMWRSHFPSPMTTPGGAAPLWLMLYKTFFTVVTFQGKQAGSELFICRVHSPVPPLQSPQSNPHLPSRSFLFILTSKLIFPFSAFLSLSLPCLPPSYFPSFQLSFSP